MAASRRDHDFRIDYTPADDPLHNFHIPALSASVRDDRSASFFSSTVLAAAALRNCPDQERRADAAAGGRSVG